MFMSMSACAGLLDWKYFHSPVVQHCDLPSKSQGIYRGCNSARSGSNSQVTRICFQLSKQISNFCILLILSTGVLNQCCRHLRALGVRRLPNCVRIARPAGLARIRIEEGSGVAICAYSLQELEFALEGLPPTILWALQKNMWPVLQYNPPVRPGTSGMRNDHQLLSV